MICGQRLIRLFWLRTSCSNCAFRRRSSSRRCASEHPCLGETARKRFLVSESAPCIESALHRCCLPPVSAPATRNTCRHASDQFCHLRRHDRSRRAKIGPAAASKSALNLPANPPTTAAVLTARPVSPSCAGERVGLHGNPAYAAELALWRGRMVAQFEQEVRRTEEMDRNRCVARLARPSLWCGAVPAGSQPAVAGPRGRLGQRRRAAAPAVRDIRPKLPRDTTPPPPPLCLTPSHTAWWKPPPFCLVLPPPLPSTRRCFSALRDHRLCPVRGTSGTRRPARRRYVL